VSWCQPDTNTGPSQAATWEHRPLGLGALTAVDGSDAGMRMAPCRVRIQPDRQKNHTIDQEAGWLSGAGPASIRHTRSSEAGRSRVQK